MHLNNSQNFQRKVYLKMFRFTFFNIKCLHAFLAKWLLDLETFFCPYNFSMAVLLTQRVCLVKIIFYLHLLQYNIFNDHVYTISIFF